MSVRKLTQIHLTADGHGYRLVTGSDKTSVCALEEAEQRNVLLQSCPPEIWPQDSYATGCPRPVLVSKHHQQQLQDLYESLTVAITDIVQRWWTDHDALFPKRMPLDKGEEEILRGALSKKLHPGSGLVNAADSETLWVFRAAFETFNKQYPLHFLKETEKGIDIHRFINEIQHRLNIKPRLITPSDLRLLPESIVRSGYRLCCIVPSVDDLTQTKGFWTIDAESGEIWEEVQQIGLELHQKELMALDPEVLREVSLRCFNDIRTIMLVHDKRMLGIVRQKVPQLMMRGLLTPAQTEALHNGIVKTVLPHSKELSELVQQCITSPLVKDQYILKPIRGGKGDGVVFGVEMGAEDWICALESLSSSKRVLGSTLVVQRCISPRSYDLILSASVGNVHYPLVGTFHVVNGSLVGLGIWRAGGGRVVAISSGISWLCSVTDEL
ncbi:hypothetical protein AB5N19_00172 [Seiridium cardinale]